MIQYSIIKNLFVQRSSKLSESETHVTLRRSLGLPIAIGQIKAEFNVKLPDSALHNAKAVFPPNSNICLRVLVVSYSQSIELN